LHSQTALTLVCTASALILLGGPAHGAPPETPAARLGPFDIEAHRGGRALRPENTLQSFANALSMGVDTLELDMGVTKDGVLVVSHERGLNPDLARGPDGLYVSKGIPYVKLTLAEVKTYDVGQIRPGSDYAARFPDQLSIPASIPTLAEVFALVRRSGDHHVRLNIETKIDPNHPEESPDPRHFVSAVLDLLRREKFVDRVMIESFDWRTLQLVQKEAPTISTVYLTQQERPEENIYLDKPSPWTAGFDPRNYGGSVPRAVKAAGGKIWSPLYSDIDPHSVAEAHSLGLRVIVWTVNSPEDLGRLIDMGVDGIISDRPDVLRAVAATKGITLPRPAPIPVDK
jgi:glycerophosphoryl diester phosphodiesterase